MLRAARVRDAMQDGVLKEALAEIEATYNNALINCHDGPAERERLWLAVQVVRKVGAQLMSWDAGGHVAERNVQEIKRLARAR